MPDGTGAAGRAGRTPEHGGGPESLSACETLSAAPGRLQDGADRIPKAGTRPGATSDPAPLREVGYLAVCRSHASQVPATCSADLGRVRALAAPGTAVPSPRAPKMVSSVRRVTGFILLGYLAAGWG